MDIKVKMFLKEGYTFGNYSKEPLQLLIMYTILRNNSLLRNVALEREIKEMFLRLCRPISITGYSS